MRDWAERGEGEERGGRDKRIDGWTEGRKGREKDERRKTVILTLCICQNPFTSATLWSHTCPLREVKPESPESFSAGLRRPTPTQGGDTSSLPRRVLLHHCSCPVLPTAWGAWHQVIHTPLPIPRVTRDPPHRPSGPAWSCPCCLENAGASSV